MSRHDDDVGAQAGGDTTQLVHHDSGFTVRRSDGTRANHVAVDMAWKLLPQPVRDASQIFASLLFQPPLELGVAGDHAGQVRALHVRHEDVRQVKRRSARTGERCRERDRLLSQL